jgi:hypothetical protein
MTIFGADHPEDGHACGKAIGTAAAEADFVLPPAASRQPATKPGRGIHDGFYHCGFLLKIDAPQAEIETWLAAQCPEIHFRIERRPDASAPGHSVLLDRRLHMSRESAQEAWKSLACAAQSRWPDAVPAAAPLATQGKSGRSA